MGKNLQKLLLFRITIPSVKDFMKKYNFKTDTMNQSELQKNCNYLKDPRDSKTYSDKRLVNLENGAGLGTHWT